MNTECDEIADLIRPVAPHFASFDDASAYVRTQMMPGESVQIIDNVAESLYRAQPKDCN